MFDMSDFQPPEVVGAKPPQRISHTHEQLLNWLILNPEKSQRECADHFGYTQSWLSTVIRSDLFQAALKDKQMLVQARVVASIPERLMRAAEIGTDKLATMIEESEDPEFVLDATDKVLHRMGYAPQSARNPAGSPSSVTQQNNFFISAEDLSAARGLIGRPLSPLGAICDVSGEAEVVPSLNLQVGKAVSGELGGGA